MSTPGRQGLMLAQLNGWRNMEVKSCYDWMVFYAERCFSPCRVSHLLAACFLFSRGVKSFSTLESSFGEGEKLAFQSQKEEDILATYSGVLNGRLHEWFYRLLIAMIRKADMRDLQGHFREGRMTRLNVRRFSKTSGDTGGTKAGIKSKTYSS